MDVLVLCAKTALACLLIVAGGAKLSDPASFASTVRLFIPFRVAWPLLSALAVGVSLGELAVGVASLTLPAVTALNALVFAIACAFVAVSAMGYAFHRGRSCRCFGALSQRRFDAAGVLRSAVLAAIAAVALVHVGAAALQLDATARVLLFAAAGTAGRGGVHRRQGPWRWSRARAEGGGAMKIPLYLAVAQWTLLFAFGLLLIVVYRQLGRTLHKDDAAAPLGPAVGSKAASLEYSRFADDTVQYLTPGDGQPALLAFVEPTCPSCEELVLALGTAEHTGELSGLRVLVLTSSPKSYLKVSDAFRATRLECGRILAQATTQAYGATSTPLLVAIDRDGVVRAAAPAIQLAEVRAFSRACLLPPDEGESIPITAAAPQHENDLEAATPAAGAD